MRLQVSFQYPFTDWSVFHVFNGFYNLWKESLSKDIQIEYVDSGLVYNGNPGSYYSPHIMTIKNKDNDKYIIVSYWDRADDLTDSNQGWCDSKRAALITSSGVRRDINCIPFSYICYTKEFDKLSIGALPIDKKPNNNLFFKGYLYDKRYLLSLTKMIDITNNKVSPTEKYFEEINNNKINLSFNGAGEICNRDIEILSARSVLLRPKLYQKFHNDLIADYNYIAFEESSNPKEQCQIIIDKFNTIKNNIDLLTYISNNGYEWYMNNGTINSNINILNNILDIQLLK